MRDSSDTSVLSDETNADLPFACVPSTCAADHFFERAT
jgi:hypothetical protein